MKPFILTLIASLFCLNALYAQPEQTITISPNFDNDISSPSNALYTKGTTLKIQADSIYIINPRRYRLYNRLHTAILDTNTLAIFKQVLVNYREAFDLQDTLNTKLTQNLEKTETLVEDFAALTRQNLGQVDSTLVTSKENLEVAKRILDEADSNIKRAKKNQWLLFLSGAGGGLLAGLLIGVIAN